jgi:hypothetical protein
MGLAKESAQTSANKGGTPMVKSSSEDLARALRANLKKRKEGLPSQAGRGAIESGKNPLDSSENEPLAAPKTGKPAVLPKKPGK